MTMNIVPSNAKQTISSLEIAELTGSYIAALKSNSPDSGELSIAKRGASEKDQP
jgi:hypothetical protein